MYRRALAPRVLMDLSEYRIERIRWNGSEDQRQIVSRLFEQPATYRHWESYHAGLMRKIGEDRSRKRQLQLMRRTRFQLIHRQALFQLLRDASIKGAQREALFRVLHSTQDYQRAVLAEHGRFLHSNSSLYCADHLAFSVMRDSRFTTGLLHYRRRYLEYFGHYCSWILADAEGHDSLSRLLLPQLKLDLQVMQKDLLALPAQATNTQH